MSKLEIHQTLASLHEAQKSRDIEGILSHFTGEFLDKSALRVYFQNLIDNDVFANRTVNSSHCETFLFNDFALVRPIVYGTPNGKRSVSYHFARQDGGQWLIIDSGRSYLPGDSVHDEELSAHVAKVVDFKGMLWTRKMNVPVETVWKTISTQEGLNTWWIISRDIEIDLKPGGLFKHHWVNRVGEVKPYESIVFLEERDQSGANQYMRFDIEPDGDGTLFHFYDSFSGVTDNPLTIPWTCSGWHNIVNALETALTGRQIPFDFGLGGEFYWRYLRNYHRYKPMTDHLPVSGVNAADWRAAYTSAPV